MTFQTLKMRIVEATGLEKDALHIYVGIGAFLITLAMTRPWLARFFTRLNLALVIATLFAIAGEYLDLRLYYPNVTGEQLHASLHDLINTCFWPYMLYGICRWTRLLQQED